MGCQQHLHYPTKSQRWRQSSYENLYYSSLRSSQILKHLRLLRPGIGIDQEEETMFYIPKDSKLTTKVFSSETVFISLLILFHFVATG